MRTTRIETLPIPVPDKVVCDCCKQETDAEDVMEAQEYETFTFVAGYNSQYNDDGTKYEVDLCQHCIRKLLGPFLRPVKHMFGEPIEVIDSM